MKIAAAQISSVVGAVENNLKKHYQLIEMAIAENIKLITFPEMSMTGYTRMEGDKLAFEQDDIRLEKLQSLSRKGDIVIIVGAPIRIKKQLHIGSFILHPNEPIGIYTKQYLHDGEELFYQSSWSNNPIIKLGNEQISLAICADINDIKHLNEAKKRGSTLYLPSIFYSDNGILEGHHLLASYASKFNLNILMSNYIGHHWGMNSGGKSAFWNTNGELLSSLSDREHGLLVVEKNEKRWKTKECILIS